MASEYRIEYDRGTKDSPQQLAVLREKWPLAFPLNEHDVRPLANSAAREIAAAMGWPRVYTLGVLGRWKLASVYCEAVLRHDRRIALDGSPAESVEPEAKEMATKRLAALAARKAAKAEKKAAKVVAPEVVKKALLPRLCPRDRRHPKKCALGCARRSCDEAHKALEGSGTTFPTLTVSDAFCQRPCCLIPRASCQRFYWRARRQSRDDS